MNLLLLSKRIFQKLFIRILWKVITTYKSKRKNGNHLSLLPPFSSTSCKTFVYCGGYNGRVLFLAPGSRTSGVCKWHGGSRILTRALSQPCRVFSCCPRICVWPQKTWRNTKLKRRKHTLQFFMGGPYFGCLLALSAYNDFGMKLATPSPSSCKIVLKASTPVNLSPWQVRSIRRMTHGAFVPTTGGRDVTLAPASSRLGVSEAAFRRCHPLALWVRSWDLDGVFHTRDSRWHADGMKQEDGTLKVCCDLTSKVREVTPSHMKACTASVKHGSGTASSCDSGSPWTVLWDVLVRAQPDPWWAQDLKPRGVMLTKWLTFPERRSARQCRRDDEDTHHIGTCEDK